MDDKPRRFRSLFISLHILHLCFSLALLFAVVHNQLANNARLLKLESRFEGIGVDRYHRQDKTNTDVDSPDVVKRSFNVKPTTNGNAANTSEDGKRRENSNSNETVRTSSRYKQAENNETTAKIKSFNEVYLGRNSSVNSSEEGSKLPLNETSHSEFSAENATAVVNMSTLVQSKSNATKEFSESESDTKNASCESCHSAVKTIKDDMDLVSCFDELKVIINTYLGDGIQQGDCQLFKGVKGQRGEKGCAGTSFAAPSFRPNPQRLLFNEGNPAVLVCTAVANPSAQITWYRDNKQIHNNRDMTPSRYVIDKRDVTPPAPDRARYCPSEIPHPVIQSTLIINRSNGSDTGRYSCVARNILGDVKYEIHMLIQVHVQLTTIPSNTTVVQGEEALLSCRASGVPQPQITWHRQDNGPMPSQHSVAMGDLHIRNISKEEEGAFVCRAENVLGPKTVKATVTVNVFPEITSFADHVIIVNENSTLILPCNATGYPNPELRWTKRDDTLPTNRSHFDFQTLNITRVRYEDRGVYMCTANNTAGVVNRTVQVFVQVAPRILKRAKATEFGYLTKTKRLEFKVLSIPEANVTWKRPFSYRSIDKRFRTESGSLVIDRVQFEDSGTYQAVARNSLGEVRISTFLVVREASIAPILLTKPSKEVLLTSTGQTVSQSCSSIGVPSPTVTWLKDGKEVTRGNKMKSDLKILVFTASDRGLYTCRAQNDFGKEEASVYLIDNSIIRLAGSSNPFEGRVEIYKNWQWGTVCGRSLSTSSPHGRIACQQLGFSDVVTSYSNARFGSGSGTATRLTCYSSYKRLQDCSVRSSGSSSYFYSRRRRYIQPCGHEYDFGVTCK